MRERQGRLALFDLDNTLLAGDSDHGWGEFMVAQGLVDGADYGAKNDTFYQDYLAGSLDMVAYAEFALAPLMQYSATELNSIHQQFMQTTVIPMIAPKAQVLLKQHRDAGDVLVIVTATNDFITAPIAEHLAIPHLIATPTEVINGRYTGKLSGAPCFKAGKIDKLNHWMALNGYSIEGACFYSDSHNDIPLLALVDEPIAVDPDAVLEAHALANGWPVMSLR
jgi:HAD superfamily hydrolase (TIGR01490 family)|tara:strand:+ start:260 stop:928 length:669 start_codon:yes stop_codon:yes gene_type:complete